MSPYLGETGGAGEGQWDGTGSVPGKDWGPSLGWAWQVLLSFIDGQCVLIAQDESFLTAMCVI